MVILTDKLVSLIIFKGTCLPFCPGCPLGNLYDISILIILVEGGFSPYHDLFYKTVAVVASVIISINRLMLSGISFIPYLFCHSSILIVMSGSCMPEGRYLLLTAVLIIHVICLESRLCTVAQAYHVVACIVVILIRTGILHIHYTHQSSKEVVVQPVCFPKCLVCHTGKLSLLIVHIRIKLLLCFFRRAVEPGYGNSVLSVIIVAQIIPVSV